MSKIYIQTVAYNAQKTIRRCMESILNQTYAGEICWDILDNGSTDDTLSILSDYSKQHSSLKIFHINQNCSPQNEDEQAVWNRFVQRAGIGTHDGEYYCMLDSDDEYELDFLEKALAFMKKNNLDVVAAGNDFIDMKTNEVINVRRVPQEIILSSAESYDCYFPKYYQFFRTVWGKVYKMSLLKSYRRNDNLSYGSDTWFVFQVVNQANRVGILAESLYKYYVSHKSVSNQWDFRRIESDRILDDTARTFLTNKCGFISGQNEAFLFAVYFNAIADTISLLLNAQITITEKLAVLHDIFLSKYTQCMYVWPGYMEEKKLLEELVVQWLFKQKECHKPEGAKTAAEIFFAMHSELSQLITQDSLTYLLIKMPKIANSLLQKEYGRVMEGLQAWYKQHDRDVPVLANLEIALYTSLHKTDDELFELLTDIRKKRPLCSTELDIDTQICELLAEYPLLLNISAHFATDLSETVRWVLKKNFANALVEFLAVFEHLEITDDDEETFILLGQNLSAAAEDADAYIYFKKVWVSYLLDCSRKDEAGQELDEFQELLPEDEDFIALRQRYMV